MFKFNKIIIAWFLLCGSHSNVVAQGIDLDAAEALFGVYNTETLGDASFLPGCIDYCIAGVCVRLICTPFGCSVDVEPLIEHNMPDLVVDVHPVPAEYAYEDDQIMGPIAEAALAGYGSLFGLLAKPDSTNMTDGSRRNSPDAGKRYIGKDHDMINKSVGIFGNPWIEVWNQASGSDSEVNGNYICSSEVTALEPYYLSESDAFNWRFGIVDFLLPETYAVGFHEVGGFHLTRAPLKEQWGPVYPRQMTVVQQVEPKAAAVLAQRAANIATYGGGTRVVNKAPLTESTTPPYTDGDMVRERDEYENWWGMVTPIRDEQCGPFGTNAYDFLRSTVDHKYSFIYWGRHWCCPGTGVLIAAIQIDDPVCFDIDIGGGDSGGE